MKPTEHNLPINFNQILSLIQQCTIEEKEILLKTLFNVSNKSDDEDWTQLNLNTLNKAYSDTEPNYDLSLVKEPNEEYVKR